MKNLIKTAFIFILIAGAASAQNFDVGRSGVKTFTFEDEMGRNQATLESKTPVEDIFGTANGISGAVSFDPSDFAGTLSGEIIVKVKSIDTGIDLRNEHLRGVNWLNAEKFPDIVYKIKAVKDLEQSDKNKLKGKVIGDLTIHGVTIEKTADFEAVYLVESDATKKRAPGDLLGITASFLVSLSKHGVKNDVIGEKVAESITVGFNSVGSSGK